MRLLQPHHLEDLRASGLSDATITNLGWFSGDGTVTHEILGFDAGPGLVIKYPSLNGKCSFTRVRPDIPRLDKKGKLAKYRSPRGSALHLYVPATLLENGILKDSSQPLVVTEGEKKAEKSTQEGFPCVALAGVWAWKQDHKPIPDLDYIAWLGRTTYILFDSDAVTKPDVKRAEQALSAELARRGANVVMVRLPGSDDGKVGLDDFLLAHGAEALAKLLVAFTPSPVVRTSWTTADLLYMDFPDPKWAVPGLIPTGLVSLAGRPKIGKSWLALQLAHAVGAGGQFLGQRVDKRTVLYLALEDGPRRLKSRLRAQHVPETAAIYFDTTRTVLDDQGVEVLEKRIEEDGIFLVIIDTFSRAIGGADQLDGGAMTEVLGHLQQMAQSKEITALLVDHHHRLPSIGHNADPIEDLYGATSKSAVVDAAIGIYRGQGRQGTTLKVIGRDMEEMELSLQWKPSDCTWESLGNAGEVRADSFQGEVLATIGELMALGELPTGTRIAKHLGKVKGQVGKAIADLINRGAVQKGEKDGREQPYFITPK